MRGHAPTALPPGFGIQGAFELSGGGRIILTDERCRTVTVGFVPNGDPQPPPHVVDRVGPWVVEYDKARACGNYVMGMGRCTGYWVAAQDGGVRVQTIGLSRAEADAVVLSIPL
jgi:hypothetical protein